MVLFVFILSGEYLAGCLGIIADSIDEAEKIGNDFCKKSNNDFQFYPFNTKDGIGSERYYWDMVYQQPVNTTTKGIVFDTVHSG